jgi:hypothetical protein
MYLADNDRAAQLCARVVAGLARPQLRHRRSRRGMAMPEQLKQMRCCPLPHELADGTR